MNPQEIGRSMSSSSTRYITLSEVSDLTTLSRATVYRLIKAGEFPYGFKLTENRVVYDLEEVHDWVRSRRQES
ncbi:helix-turn-helix transcriptional regulator [Agaribacterium sp. ZY112]|uniref:helix-turn-helix transcriptional regulator n=1 Tax=Agaribacterium sp. ZY112 TaxID=3233574 RepID=UPI0035265D9F